MNPQDQDTQEQPMDPKNQEQFDMFVANGMQIIYSQDEGNKIVKSIMESENPITIIARITLRVVTQLEDMLAGQGVEISNEAKMQGANILMGEIMAMAEQAGSKPLSQEEKEQCFSMAAAQYFDQALKTGRITPQQMQEMSAKAQETPEGQAIANKLQANSQLPATGQKPAMGGMQ